MAKKAKNARKAVKKAVKKAPKKAAKKKTAKRPAKRTTKRAVKRPPVETQRTPPSSLDMDRRASAARSGRQVMSENQRRHNKMAAVTGGDVDADMESAYFTGDEAAGGDNPTPDQSDVDEIGKAVGVEYNDNEELGTTEKVAERDKHRWENE